MLRKLGEKGLRIPEGSENQVLLAARMVREHYFPNRGKNFPDWIIIFALLKILESRPDVSLEDMFQMMIEPASIESTELRRDVHAAIAACRNHRAEQKWNEAGIFNGVKQLEIDKLSAMTAYFAAQGSSLCRRKLNVMLFYADFVNYYLHKVSISGAKYIRLCHGPVQEFYERDFDSMVSGGVLKSDAVDNKAQVAKLDESILDSLTINELTTLHWVKSTFGRMSCDQLVEHTSRESSHRFTRRGDYIAYEYSKLLKSLPVPALT